jgi:hypothetical protein
MPDPRQFPQCRVYVIERDHGKAAADSRDCHVWFPNAKGVGLILNECPRGSGRMFASHGFTFDGLKGLGVAGHSSRSHPIIGSLAVHLV